ncbi:pentatricopeptide repeat-containing protein [Cucumis melo var. makuwa]|uniref:Pentatricopeptide repeat-containing protein n=1 Tax=Cucumis melo var. makuwa TaxID=1194695 RepID=A0A5D3CKZ8_CUCMM|nr:pentatricopeptide repeat-containing protein [Cucumis melo var. makuwa]TYK12617.1 pentatricopeptide repeat-containing protein [Cucumis melo var. makuwa]
MFTLKAESPLQSTWTLLENCSNMKQLKQIQAQMIKTAILSEPKLATKFLTLCTSPHVGDLLYAQRVFNGITSPNTVMWNAIIRAYSNSKEPELAFLLYQQMLSSSVPHNSYTFPFLLKACRNLSALGEALQVHGLVIKLGFGSDVFALNALLHVYALCGEIRYARQMFDNIPERDAVSWNIMIDGYIKSGDVKTAYGIFLDMPSKNVVSWTSLISGLVGAGLSVKALSLCYEMQNAGFELDGVAIACLLTACANLGALDQGRWLHFYVLNNGVDVDRVIGCALVNMYVKCGDMEEALRVFGKLKGDQKDVCIWTAMIDGFAIHGRGVEALEWFDLMRREGIRPNSITFTAVLRACSYGGLVEEGKELFKSMKCLYNLSPSIEHYGCMVDLLGRSGRLNEAKELIKNMPMKPNAVIWGAFLKACWIHRDFLVGSQIGAHLVEVDSDHSGRYIQLATILAAQGKWKEAAEVRLKMKNLGVPISPGKSSITLNGIVHEFLAGHQDHPQMEQIHLKLKQIAERLRQDEGYEPATKDLLLDLENEEKETAIAQHSEKLAIAFGLINTKPGTTIRVVKNLRICRDCHTVAKLVSQIYCREIIMRDRVRFHHFRDGSCSCKDYW